MQHVHMVQVFSARDLSCWLLSQVEEQGRQHWAAGSSWVELHRSHTEQLALWHTELYSVLCCVVMIVLVGGRASSPARCAFWCMCFSVVQLAAL
jgi:hypothetical protein